MASLMRIEEVDGEAHADRIRRMDAICFPHDESIPDEDLASNRWWLVIGNRRAIAGYASLTPKGHLSRAGVLPRYRGRGLQRRLILVREFAARDLGIKTVTSVTAVFNVASSNNLIACGFTTYLPKGDPGTEPFIHWKKELS